VGGYRSIKSDFEVTVGDAIWSLIACVIPNVCSVPKQAIQVLGGGVRLAIFAICCSSLCPLL